MNNFYFHVGYSLEDKCVMVVICPKEYFDTYNCIIDSYFNVEKLPAYLKQEGEELFSSSKNVNMTYNDLIKLGFISDEKFSDFCKNHDPFRNEFTSISQNYLEVMDEIHELHANRENLIHQFGRTLYQYFINTGILSKYTWSSTIFDYEGRCSISLDLPLKSANDLLEIFSSFKNETALFYLNDEVYLTVDIDDLDISFPNIESLIKNIKLLNIKINLPDYSVQIKNLSEQIELLKQQQDYYDRFRND